MVDPNNVELVIFDLDGTISATTRPIYHAVKQAFQNLNVPCTLTEQELERHFGEPSEQFYRTITPEKCGVSWQDVQEEIRKEQIPAYEEFGETYDNVYETLTSLRNRGYKLALFSNSTPHYFDTVISALKLKDYFDYREAVGEHDLTKTELAGKIIRHFGNPGTAIVGDRIHDIEAARDNGALSIGVLYGFGGTEPEAADLTINAFNDLLNIFDRKLPVFKVLEQEIIERKPSNRPIIAGITGIDTAGKTEFTEGLAHYLSFKDHSVQVLHLDDFHNPQSIRYSGINEAENYYTKSFNIDRIIMGLLIPARKTGEFSTDLTVLNLETDDYDTVIHYDFTPDTIVLFEGVFLLREELRPYIDYMIFLDIPLEECKQRARGRDPQAVMRKYDTKYIPAQKAYLKNFPPEQNTDIIVDNLDWEKPKIIFQKILYNSRG